MAMKFKIFRKDEITEEVINDFYNKNIIHKDKYLENGDIYSFYTPKDDLEIDPMNQIETLHATIGKMQGEIFAAKVEIQENIAEIEDLRPRIAASSPNAGKEWEDLQTRRVSAEREIKMAKITIEGREKQLAKLKESYKTILAGGELNIEVPVETPSETKEDAIPTYKKRK